MASFRFQLLAALFLLAEGLSVLASAGSTRVAPRQNAGTATASAAAAQPTVCGDIIDGANEGYHYFYAVDAFDCLSSVPFVADVALRFIEYYNTTMQFQSTLAYLRDPPADYQQPAVDFFQVLEQIKANVTAGAYVNQYAFESELMHLVYSTHDSHVQLYAGALSTFTFGNDYPLVSASLDGKEAPKVYLADDVAQRRDGGWNISAVETINGQDVVEYLTELASLNSVGLLEPHADYNSMMYSPVQDILYTWDIFSNGLTFYPGDALNMTFGNGSAPIDDWWLASYTVSDFTGPLTTGGDFYNFFVLGLAPESYNDVPLPATFNYTSSSGDNNETENVVSSWYSEDSKAYPARPVVVQENLQFGGSGGILTGYLIDDDQTAILSVPSFDETGFDIGNFTRTLNNFIQAANETPQVIIDLQGNSGGSIFLAFVTFRRLFPSINPFVGSRRRAHDLANILGSNFTDHWNNLQEDADDDFYNGDKFSFEASEWVVTDRLNAATGTNFTSWAEYFGPRSEHDDNFSLVEQYDLANVNFQYAAFDNWEDPTYLAGGNDFSAPRSADQVIVLTDGICGSACALFVETMQYQAGVRTFVMGGLPQAGPMQAASGTRGAFPYTGDQLDTDFYDANEFSQNATVDELPELDATGARDTGMNVAYAGFNLRDQVRTAGAEAQPLQFQYVAADCRLYYTLDNVLNMTRLWGDVARAAWTDPSLCVSNSMGYSTTGNTTAKHDPPVRDAAVSVGRLPEVEYTYSFKDTYTSFYDPVLVLGSKTSIKSCEDDKNSCDKNFQCLDVAYTCTEAGGNHRAVKKAICVPTCQSKEKVCSVGQTKCDTSSVYSSELKISGVKSASSSSSRSGNIDSRKTVKLGICRPKDGSYFKGLCS